MEKRIYKKTPAEKWQKLMWTFMKWRKTLKKHSMNKILATKVNSIN